MSLSISSTDRTVLPRWVPSTTIGEIDVCPDDYNLVTTNLIDERSYLELSNIWNKRPSLSLASELVSIGALLNRRDPRIVASAEFVLKSDRFVPNVIAEMATEIIGNNHNIKNQISKSNTASIFNQIHTAKIKSQELSNNPYLHLDLALLYTTLGQVDKAQMHIKIANSFKYYSPHILRFSARFSHHTKIDIDKHLQYLRKAFAETNDPLLAAAEIGISNSIKKSSRLLTKARGIIYDKRVPDWRRSELATLVGMDELRNGSRKKSIAAFNVALKTNNENALTQLAILSESKILKISGFTNNSSFQGKEALTWINYLNGDYANAVKFANQWQEFQPFSAKPAVLLSYIESCVNYNHQNSIDIIRKALIPSPNNFVLINNSVYSYCHLGIREKASEMLFKLKKLNSEPEHEAFINANLGLFEYKFGDVNKGRDLYLKAIEMFRSFNDVDKEIRATVYYVKEEIKYSKENAIIAFRRIKELAKKTSSREVVNLLETEVKELEKQAGP